MILIHQQHHRSQGLVSSHYRCFAYVVGKEPPLLCLVAAPCCHCITRLRSSWQTPPHVGSCAGRWPSPTGAVCPASISGKAGWEESPAFPSMGCWQGEDVEGAQGRPALCTSPLHEQEQLSPPVIFREALPPSAPGGDSKTTWRVKASRINSRTAGKCSQLALYPLHGAPSTLASS